MIFSSSSSSPQKMRATLLCSLALLALVALTLVSASVHHHHHHEVVEEVSQPTGGWQQSVRASPSTTMRLLIALKQTNLDRLESTLLDVSNPVSKNFGQHWSNDAIHSLVAPKKHDVDAVLTWLKHEGNIKMEDIESTSSKDFIRVRVTVAQAEKLLHTEYYEFTHPDRPSDKTVRTMKYSVPSHIASAIDIIGPTVRFPSGRPQKASPSKAIREEKKLVKQTKKMLGMKIHSSKKKTHSSKKTKSHTTKSSGIRKLHSVHTNAPKKHSSSKKHAVKKHNNKHNNNNKVHAPAPILPNPALCVQLNITNNTMSTTPACLRELYAIGNYQAKAGTNSSVGVSAFFQSYYAPADLAQFFQLYDPTNARVPIVIGGDDWQDYGAQGEPTLDIEYSMSMGAGVQAYFMYDNTTDQNDFNLNWLYELQAAPKIPYVLSDSWGVNEEAHSGAALVRFNIEFQKLGLRGVSMLFAMGDGGVGGGIWPALDNCTVFIPAYPTSPYVTTVGGTDGYAPEAAWVGSSGGFSNWYPAPSYQTAQIANYFTKYASSLPAAGLYNTTGRGFPDVAFQATNFAIVQGGVAQTTGGTSASSPSFAGLIALLNDMRFNAGKSSLGFLNQVFYANPQIFQDITTGNNPGCNANGFYAEPGWDPVTGLGTPNFQQMITLALSLP